MNNGKEVNMIQEEIKNCNECNEGLQYCEKHLLSIDAEEEKDNN